LNDWKDGLAGNERQNWINILEYQNWRRISSARMSIDRTITSSLIILMAALELAWPVEQSEHWEQTAINQVTQEDMHFRRVASVLLE